MESQKKLIEVYTKNLITVIKMNGVNDDKFLYASLLLRAANLGLSVEEIYKYADAKMIELHEEELEHTS